MMMRTVGVIGGQHSGVVLAMAALQAQVLELPKLAEAGFTGKPAWATDWIDQMQRGRNKWRRYRSANGAFGKCAAKRNG